MMGVESTDDDDDNKDDDDDDDDSDDDGLIEEDTDVNIDPVGDFQKRMSATHSVFVSGDIPHHDTMFGNMNEVMTDPLTPSHSALTGAARYLGGFYKQFRTALSKKHENPNEMDENDHHTFNAASYPHKKRFGIFVDRRATQKKGSKSPRKKGKDIVYFHEMLAEADTLPSGHVTEWYVKALETNIIPGKIYTEDDDECDEEDASNLGIGAKNKYGRIMTFSFQVDAEDEIKCYLIWSGQMLRFKGHYLADILKFLFVNGQASAAKQQLRRLDNGLTDARFDYFYEQIQLGYEPAVEYNDALQ